jgi:hypothetical protein
MGAVAVAALVSAGAGVAAGAGAAAGAALVEAASAGAAAAVWAWESKGDAMKAKTSALRMDERDSRVVIVEKVGYLLRF